MGNWLDLGWSWNLVWRRNLFVWELEQHSLLSSELNNIKPQKDSHDKVVWLAQEDGQFSVKSSYDVLQCSTHPDFCLAMETLWDIKVLTNALSLAWRILKGKIPTRVNLSRSGVSLPSLLCPLCNQLEESTKHLFMECVIAYQVWLMVSRCVGIHTAYHNDLKNHLL